ncbi:hypothetical protein P153DRAFT_399198 [Dothidotthia symphoricarpi CBS 119687]|uniref:Uncharacterized protein n=1 Tax=Dothidotthia symphoricarpi CBS 119687 TaxID=1392245 RepID=A0A6A6A5M5_9PLEO|nr:uncharacterized protein P153DRAFT_399198 [Dothidotthia symphoricarpi CBS 119687]KAF2126414.1 hypothetical protein P153DRAFT_399198 [Dothidotthia symphoricarpi CBS 119687]
MESNLPFGYTQRHKRSHSQMEVGGRSASPAWGLGRYSSAYRDLGQPAYRETPPQSSRPRYYEHTPQRDFPQNPPHRTNDEPQHPSTTPSPPPSRAFFAHSPSHTIVNSPPRELASRRTASVEPAAPSYFRRSPSSPVPLDNPQPNRPGLHLPQVEHMAPQAPRRYAGDGLDFRRPAGVDRGDNDNHIDLSRDEDDIVIDLTADDSAYGLHNAPQNDGVVPQQSNRRRLPRGMDIIIDLDNGEEEWRMAAPPTPEARSPEIQFMGSRRIDPPPARRESVEFLREQPLPEADIRQRRYAELDRALAAMGNMGDRFVHLRAQVERTMANVNHTRNRFQRGPVPPPARPGGHIHIGAFAMPAMDFELVGFDMGLGGNRVPEPPPPTYEAPPEAPTGYTRSPQEEDVLVCPNCEDQLCEGEDEVKRQVWLVKTCGHVYCGECTTNRAIKRSAKGKEKQTVPKTKPFKECVVDDCGKKVSGSKAMIQVFM